MCIYYIHVYIILWNVNGILKLYSIWPSGMDIGKSCFIAFQKDINLRINIFQWLWEIESQFHLKRHLYICTHVYTTVRAYQSNRDTSVVHVYIYTQTPRDYHPTDSVTETGADTLPNFLSCVVHWSSYTEPYTSIIGCWQRNCTRQHMCHSYENDREGRGGRYSLECLLNFELLWNNHTNAVTALH